jgi:flagellar protein FlaF
MAVAEIIGAAIGVMLLVIVAYMLVGSVLTTAEVVSTAQKDLALQQDARMRTSFTISEKAYINGNDNFTYKISNNGTEIISDFKHMDIIVRQNEDYYIYPYNVTAGNKGTWYISGHPGDVIHPMELDPGETFSITVTLSDLLLPPEWFQMTTGNGVYASAYI